MNTTCRRSSAARRNGPSAKRAGAPRKGRTTVFERCGLLPGRVRSASMPPRPPSSSQRRSASIASTRPSAMVRSSVFGAIAASVSLISRALSSYMIIATLAGPCRGRPCAAPRSCRSGRRRRARLRRGRAGSRIASAPLASNCELVELLAAAGRRDRARSRRRCGRGGSRRARWPGGRARGRDSGANGGAARGWRRRSTGDRMQQQRASPGGRRRPRSSASAAAPAGCCARAGAAQLAAAVALPSLFMRRTAGSRSARANWPAATVRPPPSMLNATVRASSRKAISSRAPGSTGARNLTTESRGAGPIARPAPGRRAPLPALRRAARPRAAAAGRGSGRRTPDGRRRCRAAR